MWATNRTRHSSLISKIGGTVFRETSLVKTHNPLLK